MNDSACLGRKTNICLISRSRSVDEKQPSNSILTEWIGMGRSGPQITAKRQLLDCVTLTMVLLSLLFRPGKCCFSPLFIPLPPQIRAAAALACEASASRSSSGEEKLTFFQNCIPGAVRLSRTAHNRFKRFSRGAAKVLNELRVLKEENKSVLLIGTLPASGTKSESLCCRVSQPRTRAPLLAERARVCNTFYGATFLLTNSLNTSTGERPS